MGKIKKSGNIKLNNKYVAPNCKTNYCQNISFLLRLTINEISCSLFHQHVTFNLMKKNNKHELILDI